MSIPIQLPVTCGSMLYALKSMFRSIRMVYEISFLIHFFLYPDVISLLRIHEITKRFSGLYFYNSLWAIRMPAPVFFCVGLCELQLRFMAQNCPMGHKNVLCFPSDNGWGSLTYVQWSKSLNKKNANNRKTASCHKRGLILHIGSLSQNYLSSDTII